MDEPRDQEALGRWAAAQRSGIDAGSADPLTEKLQAACASGSEIEIIYYGGTTPGRRRRIRPISLFRVSGYDNSYVEAFCYTHNEVRKFRLDKISLPGARATRSYELNSASGSAKTNRTATPKSGPCFVATAVFADANHPTVAILRHYRDTELVRSSWGLCFIRIYNRLGPALAKAVIHCPNSRPIFSLLINRLAMRIQKQQRTAPTKSKE